MRRVLTLDRYCNGKCKWECEGCPYKKEEGGPKLDMLEAKIELAWLKYKLAEPLFKEEKCIE